jgi:hypothetical protein
MFKDNLDTWSKDLHCIVQLLKKILQTEPDEKRAQKCIEILFKPNITEHYGSFQRSEYGTRMNFKNMSNFAILLVILTWH